MRIHAIRSIQKLHGHTDDLLIHSIVERSEVPRLTPVLACERLDVGNRKIEVKRCDTDPEFILYGLE